MIKIAIVEDNAEERQLIKSFIDRYSKEKNISCKADLYTDGDEIVERARAQTARGEQQKVYPGQDPKRHGEAGHFEDPVRGCAGPLYLLSHVGSGH